MAEEDDSGNGRPKPARKKISPTKFITGLFTFVVVLALIGLVAFLIAVRTQWGRERVRERLEQVTGSDLVIGSTRIAFPYVLVLEDVSTRGFSDERTAGFSAREVRLSMGTAGVAVTVRRANVVLMREDGSWKPGFLASAGGLPEGAIGDVSRLLQGVSVHLEDVSVRWMRNAEKVWASASGISLDAQPVRISERPMDHFRMFVYNVLNADGTRMYDIEREWLATRDRPYIEIFRSDPLPVGEASRFWEGNDPSRKAK